MVVVAAQLVREEVICRGDSADRGGHNGFWVDEEVIVDLTLQHWLGQGGEEGMTCET